MLITLLVSFASIYAQEKYPVYCDVYLFSERDISKNAVISFDFGFDRNVDLLDESGKKMKFPSVFTAINYMAKKGWRLFSVVSGTNDMLSIINERLVGTKTTKLVTHYIMTKDVFTDDEILKGLRTSFKEPKKKKDFSDDGYMY